METEIKNETCGNCGDTCSRKKCGGTMKCGGVSGTVYCLGFVGAAVYYIQYAPTFWAGVVGILKAVAWPAFLVYEAFGYLGM